MSTAVESLGPRRSRTRSALLDAGQRLFAQRPVDAVSVDEIVLAAGVAKGSFFNHFADKHQFARSIAADIRREIESQVDAVNAGEAEPLRRLTGGMLVAANFALTRRKQAQMMLRGSTLSTGRDNALNQGLRSDIDAVEAAGLLRQGTAAAALPFWLGACQVLLIELSEGDLESEQAAERLAQVMLLALTGLGVEEATARALAADRAAQLLAMGGG